MHPKPIKTWGINQYWRLQQGCKKMKSHTGWIDAFANVFMLSGNFVCFSLAKFEIEERLIIHPSILLLSKICLLCQIEYLQGNLIFQFRVWSRRHIQSDFSRAFLSSVSDIPTQKQRNKRHLILLSLKALDVAALKAWSMIIIIYVFVQWAVSNINKILRDQADIGWAPV